MVIPFISGIRDCRCMYRLLRRVFLSESRQNVAAMWAAVWHTEMLWQLSLLSWSTIVWIHNLKKRYVSTARNISKLATLSLNVINVRLPSTQNVTKILNLNPSMSLGTAHCVLLQSRGVITHFHHGKIQTQTNFTMNVLTTPFNKYQIFWTAVNPTATQILMTHYTTTHTHPLSPFHHFS